MNKELLLALISIAIIAFGGWWLLKDDTTNEVDENPTVQTGETIIISENETAEPITNAIYDAEDIAAHATAEDCWVSFTGNVYDITEYLPIIGTDYIATCGQDATSAFVIGQDNDGNALGEATGLTVEERGKLGQYIIGSYEE